MDKVNILWTTDVRENFFNMVAMYAYNAKINMWWEQVNIIIWGKSVSLVANDAEVRSELEEMIKQGITVEACKECCDREGVTEMLAGMGIRVYYLGKSLTSYIKQGEGLITV